MKAVSMHVNWVRIEIKPGLGSQTRSGKHGQGWTGPGKICPDQTRLLIFVRVKRKIKSYFLNPAPPAL